MEAEGRAHEGGVLGHKDHLTGEGGVRLHHWLQLTDGRGGGGHLLYPPYFFYLISTSLPPSTGSVFLGGGEGFLLFLLFLFIIIIIIICPSFLLSLAQFMVWPENQFD